MGKLLVAATEKGVCAVAFGETTEGLTANLAREFPAAKIQPDEDDLQTYVRAIVEYLDGQRRTLELPLDLQATAFQLQVWTELRRIPYGETRSDKEIAERIGNVKRRLKTTRIGYVQGSGSLLSLVHPLMLAFGDSLFDSLWIIETTPLAIRAVF